MEKTKYEYLKKHFSQQVFSTLFKLVQTIFKLPFQFIQLL